MASPYIYIYSYWTSSINEVKMKVKYDKNLFIKNSCLKLEYFECECFVISIENKISKTSPTNEMSKI